MNTKTLLILTSLSLTLSPMANAALVKMSKSHICHDTNSRYYNRTKNFTPFDTLQACLDAGGRLPKGQSSQVPITTSKQAVGATYKRDYFGKGWADENHDCQNSRMEALISQSTGQVHYKTAKQCKVISGRWISPYSGKIITQASKIDIDHVVPLKWAWDHGANQWTTSQRKKFANDPANLLSVELSLNRQKGAKGLNQWLPPKNQCQYIVRFERVVKTYGLKLNAKKASQYQALKRRYC